MKRYTGLQILAVGATAALALAANHYVYHWVLLTEAFIRRVMY